MGYPPPRGCGRGRFRLAAPRDGLALSALLILLAPAPSAWAASCDGRRITVTASPSVVELGGDGPQDAELRVRVEDERHAGVADADLVVSSTAGSITDVTEVAPGEFTARLLRPEERFPQLAVVMAADVAPVARGESPCVGSTVVAFAADIVLRGRTEPGADMVVEIAGRRFGPVRGGSDGSFAIPVTVPPGENWASGLSSDSTGNASRSRINLYLPEVQRVHGFAFPAVLFADGADTAWVFASTVSRSGAPEQARVRVRAERGEVLAVEPLGNGLTRITYRAPKGVGDGRDTLKISRSGARAATSLSVRLVACAPARVRVSVAPDPVPADGHTEAHVLIEVTDSFGSPATGLAVTVAAGDGTVRAREREAGHYDATLSARERVGTLSLTVQVSPSAAVCRRGRLVGGGSGWMVVDARGVPCSGSYRVLEPEGALLADRALAERGALVLDPAVLAAVRRGARLELENGVPRRVAVGVPAEAPSVESLKVSARARWRLPAPVELRISELSRGPSGVLLRVETDGGRALDGRVKITTSSGEIRVVGSEPGELTLRLSKAGLPADVVVTDEPTGVAAWTRVVPR